MSIIPKNACELEGIWLLTAHFMSVIFAKTNEGGCRGRHPMDRHAAAAQPQDLAEGRRRHAHCVGLSAARLRAVKALFGGDDPRRVIPASLLHAAAELHSRVRGEDGHEGRPAALGIPRL